VVDRTDRYTLVGAGGRLGKLTLFDTPEGVEPTSGLIERIEVRVEDPESAAAWLPEGTEVEFYDSGFHFGGPEGLPFALVRGEGVFTNYDLDNLVLRSGDPEGSARGFVEMGFAPGEDATTVKAGEYRLRLVSSASGGAAQGMLYHLGCLVGSASPSSAVASPGWSPPGEPRSSALALPSSKRVTGSAAPSSTPAATSGPTRTCGRSEPRPPAVTLPCRGSSWIAWSLASRGWRISAPPFSRARPATG
jgi:hypothetical protein